MSGMSNALMSLNYNGLQTDEAVWTKGFRDRVKRNRFTRKAIGQFLHPTSNTPQKIIDKIIERNPSLRDTAVTVTVTATDGKNYETDTYDILGVYQIAIVSNLPRRNEFLKKFPDFLIALQNGLMPVQPTHERRLIAAEQIKEIAESPHGHKTEAMEKLAEGVGRKRSTIYYWKKRLNETGACEPKYTDGWEKRRNDTLIPRWKAIVEAINIGKSLFEIIASFNVSKNTIYRIKREYSKRFSLV